MLSEYKRFAVYYAPPKGSDFATAGAAWLGWDADAGKSAPHPDLGLDLDEMTATPRKYGLHATIKPPLRLTVPPAAFLEAVEALAQSETPVNMGRLQLRPLDGFLAIVPEDQPQPLVDLAARVVRDLDAFRAPLTDAEFAKRRTADLSLRQVEMLRDWGYPYVMNEYWFHVTLSGRLSLKLMPEALRAAQAWFGPVLEHPHWLRELAVFGEDARGQFHVLRRFPLGG